MLKNKLIHRFRLFSAILVTVCVILVGDSIAPTASIGYSQYFWWAFLLLAFFLPYGLISAELSTQYPSEGGIYTWVKQAFGPKWAGRVAWFYWVNFPIWIASLADLITTYLLQMLGFTMTWPVILAIQAGYIFLVSILGVLRISQSAWLASLGSIVKVLFMAGLGILGIYVFVTQGTANPVNSWTDFFPFVSPDGHVDFTGLSLVAMIIFNMLGFEVISTFGDDMVNPKKEIPRALIVGGILIAIAYLLPSFGISVATKFDKINLNTGMLDSYQTLLAAIGLSAAAIKALTLVIGGFFIYTLVANISSWNFGINSVVAYAAEDGAFPKSWAKRNRAGVPYVVSIWTCLLALVISALSVVIVQCVPAVKSTFWPLFTLSLVILLLAYLPMFFAFIKLHKRGLVVKRGYWIKGGRIRIFLTGFIPALLVTFSLFFTLVPEFNTAAFERTWFLIVGMSAAIIIGEFAVLGMKRARAKSGRSQKSTRTRRPVSTTPSRKKSTPRQRSTRSTSKKAR